MGSFESSFEFHNKQPEHYLGKLASKDGRILDYNFDVERKQETDPDGLSICGSCSSDLVYPVEWDEAGPTHWEVAIRCPNCEWTGTGIFSQTIAEQVGKSLDHGTETLARDLKRMMHANIEDEADILATAFEADVIDVEDIRTWAIGATAVSPYMGIDSIINKMTIPKTQ
jgi:hypothetical protein